MLRFVRSLAVLPILVSSGCGGGGGDPRCAEVHAVAGLTLESVLAHGEFPVGTREVDLAYDGLCFDGEQQTECTRELKASVHYPAEQAGQDAPLAAGGPFPLVIYGHGLMSSRGENSVLLETLASRGYVTIAPTFPHTSIDAPEIVLLDVVNQPADLSFMIDWVLDRVDGAPSPFPAEVDESVIVSGGLSLGAMSTLLATYHGALRDPRITAAFAIAPPAAPFTSTFYATTSVPLLLIAGTEDAVVAYPQNAEAAFEQMLPPAERVTLVAGSHLAFAQQGLFFESLAHPDTIACALLADQIPTGEGLRLDLGEHGSLEYGIALMADLGVLCPVGPLPRAMRPRRQLELTTASVVSFLEGRVRGDEAHAQFLREGIPGDGCDAAYAAR